MSMMQDIRWWVGRMRASVEEQRLSPAVAVAELSIAYE